MSAKVLFVCMGNICRSPAAEGVMRHLVSLAGAEIEVDSAGTHDYHIGELPDSRMRAAGKERGYDLESRARQVTRQDLKPGEFSLVIAMDAENHAGLMRLAGSEHSHIRMFSDFLDGDWPRDVPDPYYGKRDGFDRVLDMLEAGCPAILKSLTSSSRAK